MGKYTDALKKLDKVPQLGPEGGDFRSKVFDAKLATPTVLTLVHLTAALEDVLVKFRACPDFQSQHEGRNPVTRELIDVYVKVRRAMDTAAEVTSALEVVKTAVEERLAEQFENEGIDTLKTDDGIVVRHQPEPYAQITNPDELREWYKTEGMERALNPAWGSVNALTKERLLAAQEPPPGVTLFNKSAHFVVTGLRKKE